MFQQQKRYYALFMAGFLVLLGGGWFLTELLGKLYQSDQSVELRVALDASVNRLNREIYAADGGVIALAGISAHHLEQRPLPKDHVEAANLAVDQLAATVKGVAYLMDTSGSVLVASNRETTGSFVGKNYRFRPYFQQAMERRNGAYFAYGVTSKEPGYYASAPIYDQERKEIIGVAVIKKTLNSGELGLRHAGEAYLVSPDGVALLTSREGFSPQPLWPLMVSVLARLEESKQFGPLAATTPMFPRELRNNGHLILEQKHHLVGRAVINPEGWSILLLKPERTTQVNRMLGIFITLLGSLLMIIYYLVLHRETTVLFTARRMAESASQAKSLFLANMSHEIRTPINAIMGMTHLAQQLATSPRQQHYLSRIGEASRSLLHILNDILDFSKIEAGKLALEILPFSMDKVVDQVAAMVVPRTQEKALELIVSVEREKCLSLGMNDYIAKPFDPKRLFLVLQQWLGERLPVEEEAVVVSVPEPPPVTEPRNEEEVPVIAGIDTPTALRRMNGNSVMLKRLLVLFSQSHRKDGEQLREAWEQGNEIHAARMAHTLKGVAGNLGALELQRLSERLEQVLRAHLPEAKELLDSVMMELARLCDTIDAWHASAIHSPTEQVHREPARWNAAFTTILRQLEQFDLDALEQWEQLLPELQGLGHDAEVQHLSFRIQALEHDKAARSLRELAHALNVELGG